MRVITGIARGMKLIAPEGLDVRPTSDKVKEGIFSAMSSLTLRALMSSTSLQEAVRWA